LHTKDLTMATKRRVDTDKKDTQKKENLLTALEASLGVVSVACKKANVHRSTHYRWLKEDEEYKAAVDSIDDLTLDFAETALHTQIKRGNVVATIFLLKTRGKKRGYVERTEVDHSGEVTSNTIIKWGDKEIKV
jgi:hypothetical protein